MAGAAGQRTHDAEGRGRGRGSTTGAGVRATSHPRLLAPVPPRCTVCTGIGPTKLYESADSVVHHWPMIITISAVEPFGDYGVGVHTSEPLNFTACFDAAGAVRKVRDLLVGPDDRLQVHGASANPVFVEALNALLGTAYKPWQEIPSGFFSAAHLAEAA